MKEVLYGEAMSPQTLRIRAIMVVGPDDKTTTQPSPTLDALTRSLSRGDGYKLAYHAPSALTPERFKIKSI